MHGLQQILVGLDLHHGDRFASTDLPRETQAALDEAALIAKRSGAAITLCAVLELSEQAKHLIEVDVQNLHRTVEDAAQAVMNRVAAQLDADGVKVFTALRFGKSWEQLCAVAKECQAGLIIVGTRRRSTGTRMLFGSTAQKLLHYAPAPVLVVKPEEMREVREIAVASDFSEPALAAVKSGVELAQALQAKLFVLHALEFPFEAYLRTAGVSEEQVRDYRQKLHAEAMQNLEAQLMQTDARTLPYGALLKIVEGSPDVAIPAFIDENQVDLLVIGTVGRTGLAGVLLGNTAERLLPVVHSSLLAVRAK
jgi:universal stress protein E